MRKLLSRGTVVLLALAIVAGCGNAKRQVQELETRVSEAGPGEHGARRTEQGSQRDSRATAEVSG